MTIKDLAAQTGYSVGTISRVLNNQPNVSGKAREIILQAAAESGFQLNANAKQLKQQHGNSILVIVKGTSNELFSRLVEAIQIRVAQTDTPLVVDYIDELDNEVRRAVQLCREKKPIGVLFLGGDRENFLADFHPITLPCVLVTNDAEGLPFENLSSVTSDDILAGRMAIEHLVSLGHRKFAIIGGDPALSNISLLRYQGCLEVFRENGIPFNETQDFEITRFSYADGYRAIQNLLARGREFTALFAMSDVMAIGAIRALHDMGKKVPLDVSVVGFDGLDVSDYTFPRLTSIRQSVDHLAELSLELLHCGQARYETIPLTLLVKESTRVL